MCSINILVKYSIDCLKPNMNMQKFQILLAKQVKVYVTYSPNNKYVLNICHVSGTSCFQDITVKSNKLICKQANKFSNKSKYRKVSTVNCLKCFENRQDGDLN